MSWIKEKKSAIVATVIVILCTAYWTWFESNSLALIGSALVLIMLALVLFRNEEFLSLFFLLLPNIMMLKLQGLGSALLGYIAILFVLKLILLDRKRIAIDNKLAALVIAHLVLVAVTVIKNHNVSLVSALVRFLGVIVVALWLIGDCQEKPQLRGILLDSFVYGCVLNVISTTVYHALVAGKLYLPFFAGINNDRNYFSIALAVGMQLALIRMLVKRRIDIKNSLSLLILLYGGIRSASRTFLVLCLPAVLLFILLLCNLEEKKQLRIVLPALGVLLVATGTSPMGARLLEVLRRFTGEDVLSANKRTEEWFYYLSRTFSTLPNALFGAGSASRVIAAGEYPLAEHSSYVQALFETGLCGLVSFTAVFASVGKKMVNGAVKLSAFLPLITLLVGYSMLSAYYSDTVNYSLLLSLVAMSLPELKKQMPLEERNHEARTD